MSQQRSLAARIAAQYGILPTVEAVVLAGSQKSGVAPPASDIDVYVYSHTPLPVSARSSIATARAERLEINNQFWEPGDEWIEREPGTCVDIVFRSVAWIKDQLDCVLRRHEASVGYSTCVWYNVLTSQVLGDPHGWFERLQQSAQQPYPEALRRATLNRGDPRFLRHSCNLPMW